MSGDRDLVERLCAWHAQWSLDAQSVPMVDTRAIWTHDCANNIAAAIRARGAKESR